MKNRKNTSKYPTRIVCTDGSTFTVNYPFVKNDVFLITDLKNNPAYLSPLKGDLTLDTRFKAKQKSLQFDFMTLVKPKK